MGEKWRIPNERQGCTHILELDSSGGKVLRIVTEFDQPRPLSDFFSLQSGLISRPMPVPRRTSPPEPPPSQVTIEGLQARKCPNCGAMMVKEGCCGGQERWRCTRCSYRSL